MSRSAVSAVLLLATTMLAASAAEAQYSPVESDRMVSVGLGGGVSVPVSDAKDAFKTGFNGQGFVKLNLRMLPVRPRLDFTFQRFDLKGAKIAGTSTGAAGSASAVAGTGTVLAGVANVQVPLLRGRLEPYLVAGLGAYSVNADVDNVGSKSKTQFGINGGAGATLRLGVVSVYAEGRVDNVFSNNGVIDAKSVQVVPVTFGVVY